MPLAFYLSDAAMVILALAVVASARAQRRHKIVKRWVLLLPGLLAALAVVADLAFPQIMDLVNLQIWTAGVVGFLIGGLRGQFMRLDSDHNWGLVRTRDGRDELWVAYFFAAVAIIHFGIEMHIQTVSAIMPSGVLAMTLTGGYLLGRSLIGWIRAGQVDHVDLRD